MSTQEPHLVHPAARLGSDTPVISSTKALNFVAAAETLDPATAAETFADVSAAEALSSVAVEALCIIVAREPAA
jgi:4-diphosphocytidyl-2C-methyl-D-erythritol kinase